MKTKMLIGLMVLAAAGAEARRGGGDDGPGHHDDGGLHHGRLGCEVKVNQQRVLQSATSGVQENVAYRFTTAFGAGKTFTAELFDKQSADTLVLVMGADGVLAARLTTDENPASPLELSLEASGERFGLSSSGDNMKLERETRGTFLKGEAYLRTNEVPSNLIKLECYR